MFARLIVVTLAAGALAALATAQERKPDEKKEEKKSGTVTGMLTAKGDNWIEVKADGEEKARRYVPHWVGGNPNQGGGPDKKMVEVIKGLNVGSRVRVEWEFEERPRVVKVDVLKASESKEEPKDAEKKGTVTGKLTAKDKNWIEVQADGEEKARRYTVYRGGTPEMLNAIKEVLVDSRVRVEWLFSERLRVMKLEVIKAAEKDK
jgi:hypothetical protein